MNLKSRLSRLQSQTGVACAASKPTVSELRSRIAQLEKQKKRGRRHFSTKNASVPFSRSPFLALNGEQIADGVIRIQKRLPLTGRLGSIPLRSLRNRPCLPGEPKNENRRRVYIDTETTGLSGGSGTLAFLIGSAVVKNDAVELTQLLMTRFSAEAATLSSFAETLRADDQLLSYNGKSYDLPLLISRFRMHAMQHPFDGLPHLDLLHPVRRLFSRRWHDCRLLSLEQNLLGFSRIDDLPGSEAPAAWFSYVRSGQAARLIKVIKHNQQDIVSLAVAHSALTQAVAQPLSFNVDLYPLARWLSESNEDDARELLQSHTDELCDDGKRLLGHLARRAGRWSQAIAIWKALAGAGCSDSLERLAKYHEHVSKDLAAARRCADGLPNNAACEHRRRRIEGKLNHLL
jgi:uncharacterized protein YprB with RNaseH-like and TPR domain